MMALYPSSLRLTAIYGLVIATVNIVFGSTLGGWIDRTKRLKGAGLNHNRMRNSNIQKTLQLCHRMLARENKSELGHMILFYFWGNYDANNFKKRKIGRS